jgi:1-acyl-sn-glycerol-3-phosphate acyltransferase
MTRAKQSKKEAVAMATARTANASHAAGSRGGKPQGKPRPVPSVTRPVADRVDHAPTDALSHRDPEYLTQWLPWFERYSSYFSSEVRGLDNLPADGPALVIANHSGHYFLADACLLMQSIAARRGVDKSAYTITYGTFFKIPWIGQFMRRVGCLPADANEADAALDSGALVLDFPGGDWDAERPWTFRNRIQFMDHKGFVKLALHHGVPVIPAVTHGAHQTVVVVTRGERIAQALGLRRALHMHVLPFLLGPPLGISPMPMMVLPSKVTLEFLPPIDWSHYGAEAADDEEIVGACYDEITGKMQQTLDRLNRERPHPITQGTVSLVGKVASAPLRVDARSVLGWQAEMLARPAGLLARQAGLLGRQVGWLQSQGTCIASRGRQFIIPSGTKLSSPATNDDTTPAAQP